MLLKTIDQIREKTPKLITYFLLIIIFALVSSLVLPLMSFLKEIAIFSGITLYQAINLFFIVAILFLVFQIWVQLSPIMNFFVEKFYSMLPGSKKVEKRSIRRILYDVAYIIVVILIVTSVPIPLSYMIGNISNVFSFIGLIIIFLLLFDLGRTSYEILSSKIEELNGKLSNTQKEKKQQVDSSK